MRESVELNAGHLVVQESMLKNGTIIEKAIYLIILYLDLGTDGPKPKVKQDFLK